LVLSSDHRDFGGWSDLAVNEDGSEILAISDQGHWLRAGSPMIVTAISLESPILRSRPCSTCMGGRFMAVRMIPKAWRSNGRTICYGPVVISFEIDTRLWRYDLSQGLDARPTEIPLGDWAKLLPRNRQIEALTLIRPDTLLAFAEEKLNSGTICWRHSRHIPIEPAADDAHVVGHPA
jgi:hypothetical protein